jgi:hypothetical protein
LKEKVIPDESDFQKNREQTSEVIMRNKREEAITQFLKALKTKAKISVNTELFSSV